MKKALSVIAAVIYAALYPFCCISTSFDPRFTGYFAPHGTFYTYTRYVIILLVMITLTALIRNNHKFISYYTPIALSFVTLCAFLDYFHTHHLLYNFAYALWLCVAICVANIGVFSGATLFFKEGYSKFFRNFWLSFTPIYLFILYVSFVRAPYSYALTFNSKLFDGTLKYFVILFHHPRDLLYLSLVCFGNLFVLLPLPFIIKAFFRKTPIPVLVIIGLLFPLLIEGYQYVFKCGNVDIDDIVLNWTGFFLGVIICHIIEKKKLSYDKDLS